MASNIDVTMPVHGVPTTQSVRDNFAITKAEIEALQAAIEPFITGAVSFSTLTVTGPSRLQQAAFSSVIYPDVVATASLPAAGAGGVMMANDAINPLTNTATGPELVRYQWDGTWRLVGSNELPQTTAYASIQLAPNVRASAAGGLGLFGTAAISTKPTVTGAKGGSAALASLLTALASYGLITDSTTA